MQIGSLINHAIPEISQQISIGEALDKMELLKLNQLPVVANNQFKGLVYEDKLVDFHDSDFLIEGLPLDAQNCYLLENQHYSDALKVAQTHLSEIVAIVGPDLEYLGVVSVTDIVAHISRQYYTQQLGATLVLSMFERDYSLAELSRLVEANNIKIIHAYVETDPVDAAKILVTIKINQLDYTKVAATLERFNFIIVEQYGETANTNSDLDRLGSFLRYLDV